MKCLIFSRSILLTIWFFFHTMICAIITIIGSQFGPSRFFFDFVVRTLWARPVLLLGNIKVEVRGLEKWPKQAGCLVLFNHTSWVDILVLAACLPRVPRFGAKIELFRIPLFGRAMRKSAMLPIERHSRAKVLKVYKDAEHRAAQGECFALAPEGTRQTDLVLGRFKQGPFLFALGAQTPLVPVVISGARDIMPKNSLTLCPRLWRGKIIMEIADPIPTNGLGEADLTRLQDQTRASMSAIYDRLNQELGLTDKGPALEP